MRLRRLVQMTVLSTLLFAAYARGETPAAERHYDEIFASNGQVRPQYQGIYDLINAMSPDEQKAFLNKSYLRFSKDNKLDPMPRVLLAAEYDRQIAKGVEQRARAIMAFLKDHYSGAKTYRSIVSENVIDRIIERNGELGYAGLLSPDQIAFSYGPDIIRDADGAWRVIEDNPGFIGGPGDLKLAQKLLLENAPRILDHVDPRDPDEFYRKLTQSYKDRAASFGGKAVLLMSPYLSDGEDKRVRRIMSDHGIETIFPREGNDLALLVKADGVYMYRKSLGPASSEKVGFVGLMGEHAWFDPTHPAAWERLVLEETKELLSHKDTPQGGLSKKLRAGLAQMMALPRSQGRTDQIFELIKKYQPTNMLVTAKKDTAPYAGLLDAILKGRVGSSYSPGVEFVGDKQFYVYVEKFIEFYLKEKPILRNIDTKTFVDANGALNRQTLDRVFNDLSKLVVKRVDGRGGNAVWVGPKIAPEQVGPLKRLVEQDPASFIVQSYTPLSRLRDLIVDMRVISDVYSKAKHVIVNVANTAWGRGTPASGNGKVNISDEGREVTVLVDRGVGSRACRAIFETGKAKR